MVEYEAGSLTTAVISNAGSNYTSRPAGVINALPYYYCNITGDGSGAVARITVVDGSVTEINLVRGGSGYTYGVIDFVAGRSYETLADLDRKANGLNPEGNGDFLGTVIIPPAGGWGTNIVKETGAVTVGVFSEFGFSDTDFIADVQYRQLDLIVT